MKRITALILVLMLMVPGVSFATTEQTNINETINPATGDIADYTYMVFLNGTDLESEYDEEYQEYGGAASADLEEMMKIGSTDDVNIIVHTGGTKHWVNENIDENQNQVWYVEKGAIKNLDNLGKHNMGDKDTLRDYIIWTIEHYPAEKYVLNLWNHGGGSVVGYGVDEWFDYDSLTLDELELALKEAKAATGADFEVIGFDACLMATIETAEVLDDYSDYLVASEELEPGHGWSYEEIFKVLTAKPEISGDMLGRVIADSYKAHAIDNETTDGITLSVIDLSKIDNVTEKLENLVSQLASVIDIEDSFYRISSAASNARAFGGNTEEQGYTDLIDLASFANNLSENYPTEAEALVAAIDEAVVYKINDEFSTDTMGISIYLPYKDKEYFKENLAIYALNSFSDIYKQFIGAFSDEITESGNLELTYTVYAPETYDQYYELAFDEQSFDRVKSVYLDVYQMVYSDEPYMRGLGHDLFVYYNEETGTYFEAFDYVWTGLDNHPVYLNVVFAGERYVDYEIPVILNGEDVNILATWIFDNSESGGYYVIRGARSAIDEETNMPDKNLTKLKAGDVVEPLFEAIDFETGESFIEVDEAFTLTEDSNLGFVELDITDVLIGFYIQDFYNEMYYTDYYEIIVE